MAHDTMRKFGYPATTIAEYRHWCVLLRPAQATLGSLVLICTENAQAFSDISGQAFEELAQVTNDIEKGLTSFRQYQKINYLMLMMVDKEVHFHVIPRYASPQSFASMAFDDPGWPAVPDLGHAVTLDDTGMANLHAEIKSGWSTG